MPRWVLIAVTVIGILLLGGTAGWYAYQDANYVTSDYAYVTSPYAWVTAPQNGQITQVLAATGQHVNKGQILFDEQPPGKSGSFAIRAAASGVIGDLNVTQGAMVEQGENLGAVVDLNHVTVVAEVPEAHSRNLALNQSVDVYFSEEPGQAYRGTISHLGSVTLTTLSPILQVGSFAKKRQWIPVTITLIDSPGNLRDGENASVRVHI